MKTGLVCFIIYVSKYISSQGEIHTHRAQAAINRQEKLLGLPIPAGTHRPTLGRSHLLLFQDNSASPVANVTEPLPQVPPVPLGLSLPHLYNKELDK